MGDKRGGAMYDDAECSTHAARSVAGYWREREEGGVAREVGRRRVQHVRREPNITERWRYVDYVCICGRAETRA